MPRPAGQGGSAGFAQALAFFLQDTEGVCCFGTVQEDVMASTKTPPARPAAEKRSSGDGASTITREHLVQLLNEDLAREYQAIIAYVVYSQVLKGAQYMSIAEE